MTEIQELSKDLSETHSKPQKPEKLELVAHLDELLEKYLRTLDEYDKAQRQLWRQLSSGYMSLAQANFNSGSFAVRYGPDYYDERMQAIRKVNILEADSEIGESRMTFSICSSETNILNDANDSESKSTPLNTQEDPKNEKSPNTTEPDSPSESAPLKETPLPQQADAQSNEETEKPEPKPSSSSSSKATKSLDPLRWFGILVPPALRTAQSTFTSAVEGPIPNLATWAKDLRSQEIEIGRMRKQIKKM